MPLLAHSIENSTNNHNGPFGAYPNEQVDWLQKDLAAVDRNVTPWVVASIHRPWITSVEPDGLGYPAWQQAFERTLWENEVRPVCAIAGRTRRSLCFAVPPRPTGRPHPTRPRAHD